MSPVIDAPETWEVNVPEMPVIVVPLIESPVTVAPETSVVPTRLVPVMLVPEILDMFALVPVRLNIVPVPKETVLPVIVCPLRRIKLPVPIVAKSASKVVMLPVEALMFAP